jgi:DNA-binding response OmpR family regulator
MKHVLVVDNHPELLQKTRQTLEKAGYRVLTAKDGAEASELLETQQVDLILADVGMPYINGYQLYERIKASPNPRFAVIPFIFLSSRALDSDIRYGKSLGADDYLVKPVNAEDLLAVVKGKLRAAERLQLLFDQQRLEELEAITLRINKHDLHLDCKQHRVWSDGQEIGLTAREMFLLEHLARQPNRVVNVVELFRITSGQDVEQQEAGRLMRPIIHSLRGKLKACLDGLDCIRNVRGRGYMLIVG